MNIFEKLIQQWSAKKEGLDASMLQKIYVLIATEDKEQILSTFELLYSYGEHALCAILCQSGEQILLRRDVNIRHPLLWEKCILDEVVHEDNILYPLYIQGAFWNMEFHVFEEEGWEELTVSKREQVRKESLRMVFAPAGSFMMGALESDLARDTTRNRAILSPFTKI